MNKTEKETFLSGLLIGIFAGAIVSGISALLMAPYSGEVTRRLIKARGNEFKSDAERRVNDALRDVEGSLTRANESVTHLLEKSREAANKIRKPSALAGNVVEKVLE